jgi:hypothetical protein
MLCRVSDYIQPWTGCFGGNNQARDENKGERWVTSLHGGNRRSIPVSAQGYSPGGGDWLAKSPD